MRDWFGRTYTLVCDTLARFEYLQRASANRRFAQCRCQALDQHPAVEWLAQHARGYIIKRARSKFVLGPGASSCAAGGARNL